MLKLSKKRNDFAIESEAGLYTKKKLPPCLKPSLTLDHKHFICLLYTLNLSFFSYLLYWNKNKGIIYCTNFLPFYHLSALLMSNLLSRLTFAVEISHNDTGEKPQNSFYQSNSYKIGNYTVSSFFIVYI